MDLARVASVAAGECVRQQVGLDRLVVLLKEYELYSLARDRQFTIVDIRTIAWHIEPTNGGKFRNTPVQFANTALAVHPDNVESAFRRHCAFIPVAFKVDSLKDRWIKTFLDIHPFTDGNGRTAWILRTWLFNEWDYPNALPDYYGV